MITILLNTIYLALPDLRRRAFGRLSAPRTAQTAEPARKLTRFWPTWMRMLLTSRTPEQMESALTPVNTSFSCASMSRAVSADPLCLAAQSAYSGSQLQLKQINVKYFCVKYFSRFAFRRTKYQIFTLYGTRTAAAIEASFEKLNFSISARFHLC